MNEEEAEKRISELKEKFKKNKYNLDQLETTQKALKLLINSSYGAISSRTNPCGSDDIANAITKTGSQSIQEINNIGKRFISLHNPSLNEEELQKSIVFNDTDSMGISLFQIISDEDMFNKNKNKITKKGYALVQELDDYVNNEFTKWIFDKTNSKNITLNFKREKICDIGIWIKKKNYILNVLDNEGDKHPKIIMKGVEISRSTIPKELKVIAKDVVETMLKTKDIHKSQEKVQELYDKFLEMPIEEKSNIKKVNNILKYNICKNGSYDIDENGLKYILRTPSHVKASINYNYIIKKFNYNQYEEIKSGDNIKTVYLKKNKYNFDCIAYKDKYPKEFEELFEIDMKQMFNKVIFNAIDRIYQAVGWKTFNPSSDYAISIFDILGI